MVHAERQQQSKSNQLLTVNRPTESDKQPATEYSVCIDDESREVTDPATPTQALGSPVDQELPDYYNVDAINIHMDGVTV